MTATFVPTTDLHMADTRTENAKPESQRSVLTRMAGVIDAFESESVLSLRQLTTRTGLPRSTTYRLAEQLVDIGWLDHTRDGYRIGLRLFELGGLAPKPTEMRNSAAPWVRQAHDQSRLTVHLGVLEGDDVVYLDKMSPRQVKIPTRVGGRRPSYCTGLGKALLAFESDARIQDILSKATDADTTQVARDLEQTRTDGYASECGEAVNGLACVAAPVRGSGRALAAISITGPVQEFNYRRYASIAKFAAKGVWQDLFAPGR